MSRRVVVITGAASGIGLACVQAFLERGDRVVAHYRSAPKGLAPLARQFGGQLKMVQGDLASEQGCVELFAQLGEVDVLVHSAGIWAAAPIRSLQASELETMFRVNTFSAYFLAREAASRMAQGSMVFIGSTAGQRGEPGHSHYAGSKAALWGLVQSLAQELAPNIRVNLVSPGWVRTPMAEPALAEAGREARIIAGIPLRRIAEPEDVAAVVLFLADPAQRHLTGVDVPVSGGALLPLPRG
ncbi:MAG: SDR family oxidoreductase [Thermoanaerobaculum sp.]|nr:SDR family oxidoreductase [Thermoanaerobaculum sp.]MDW7968217.1 SDR family oxidoreductase [Thermoanaerobaculum sp.]